MIKSRAKFGICADIAVTYLICLIAAYYAKRFVSLGQTALACRALNTLLLVIMMMFPALICFYKKTPLANLGYSGKNILKQILIAPCLAVLTVFLFVVVPILLGEKARDVLSPQNQAVEILIINMVFFFFVGFSEEFVFRGFLYDRVKSATSSEWLAILVTSLLFGFSHYPNGKNLFQVMCTTIIGLIYGFSRYKLKNCTVASLSIAHGLHDSIFAVLGFILLKQ